MDDDGEVDRYCAEVVMLQVLKKWWVLRRGKKE
jgi:hypothetical protein